MNPNWYDQAVESLEDDFVEGFITWEEFHYEMRQLNAELQSYLNAPDH